MKSELIGRNLWYDGVSELPPHTIAHYILQGIPISKICSAYEDEDLKKFNLISDITIQIGKSTCDLPTKVLQVPDEYKTIDILEYTLQRCPDKLEYLNRVHEEYSYICQMQIEDAFRTIIFILDTFKREKVIWGLGRGSSCASLILHLIGLHVVDPIKFGISLHEFFHD